jgi:hypothetical protein
MTAGADRLGSTKLRDGPFVSGRSRAETWPAGFPQFFRVYPHVSLRHVTTGSELESYASLSYHSNESSSANTLCSKSQMNKQAFGLMYRVYSVIICNIVMSMYEVQYGM